MRKDEPSHSGQPSVLDYLKSKLAPWKYPPVVIPPLGSSESPATPDNPLLEPIVGETAEITRPDLPALSVQEHAFVGVWPWRALSALMLALAAQRVLEPNNGRNWNETAILGVLLYLAAAMTAAWAGWRNEWRVPSPPKVSYETDNLRVRGVVLFIGVALALLAFITASDNRFTLLNICLLLFAIVCLFAGLWQRQALPRLPIRKFTLGRLGLLVLIGIALGISVYFRFAQLDQIPGEMNSDHAEKILDIINLLAGQTSIFFPNNGGREALQMYLAAGVVKLFGMNLDFSLLKIISAGVGFFALPFIYLIGAEIANARVGLLSMVFAGVAYWPNVVSRLGLRLPFYFLFAAATLYFLIRGLRRGRRNDFILLGLVLGLSLYGYSADRILPFLALLGIVTYLLHKHTPEQREQALWFGLMALIIAGVVFMPMLRSFLDQPDIFLYRTLTRVSGLEQPLPAPAAIIFLRNLWRALGMFSWSNGEIWTTSIPFRPALDVISGALFWLGSVITLMTYLTKRHWVHLFLLISIPILLTPSILALAFPSENPNLYRTAGAAIPVFLLIGLALDSLMTALEKRSFRSDSKLPFQFEVESGFQEET